MDCDASNIDTINDMSNFEALCLDCHRHTTNQQMKLMNEKKHKTVSYEAHWQTISKHTHAC